MCGRFARTSSREVIAAELGVTRFTDLDLAPRYNIAPSQPLEVIVADGGERRLGPMKWGLSTPARAPQINARSENVATQPLFREAFRRRRCLVVADGFYEWRKDGAAKTPFFLHLRSGRPFAFAGIWVPSRDPQAPLASCALLTCAPNALVAPIHDRMPVILPPGARDLWLDPAASEGDLKAVLAPLSAAEMEAYEVSSLVGSPKNDSPELIRPLSR
jgi:putative SOS response-associated peptidase YedK